MADPRGFLKLARHEAATRPVDVRIRDWREVYERPDTGVVEHQASRCMDCGVPFCHQACPLGNIIPEWNDLVYRQDWQAASERLHATNNFPDFTGRLCPAPCEAACVLAIDPATTSGAVTIKKIEQSIADRAFDEGWLPPQPAPVRSGRSVAIIGSGPAGLAAAQQLTRAGHDVVVFERADRIGGLLRYGIPEFKLEKQVLDRRLEQMRAEGTQFRTGTDIGAAEAERLRADFDAVVIAVGSTVPRDLPVPGRDLDGVHQAMEYLPLANRVQQGDIVASPIDAGGKNVVIIGGGDTGADCLGTAHRQGATSVVQLEIMPQPPASPSPTTPWPTWPLMLRTSPAHEEGGQRRFSASTLEFLGAGGRVRALRLTEVRMAKGRFEAVPGTESELPCDLALLALGFTGPEPRVAAAFGLQVDARGAIARDGEFATDAPGVFVAGDAGRGQSLIVWAIAEGRSAAAAVDAYLGAATVLPAPIVATAKPLT